MTSKVDYLFKWMQRFPLIWFGIAAGFTAINPDHTYAFWGAFLVTAMYLIGSIILNFAFVLSKDA